MGDIKGFLIEGTVEKYDYNSLANKPDLTKKYEKPASGIPKTDLAKSVQDSISKADTALQEHQDISGKADKTEVASAIAAERSYADTIEAKAKKK